MGSSLTQEMLIVENTEQRHAPYVPALNKALMGQIGVMANVSGVEVLAILIINVPGSFSTQER